MYIVARFQTNFRYETVSLKLILTGGIFIALRKIVATLFKFIVINHVLDLFRCQFRPKGSVPIFCSKTSFSQGNKDLVTDLRATFGPLSLSSTNSFFPKKSTTL
jgi:hypothetical protein